MIKTCRCAILLGLRDSENDHGVIKVNIRFYWIRSLVINYDNYNYLRFEVPHLQIFEKLEEIPLLLGTYRGIQITQMRRTSADDEKHTSSNVLFPFSSLVRICQSVSTSFVQTMKAISITKIMTRAKD